MQSCIGKQDFIYTYIQEKGLHFYLTFLGVFRLFFLILFTNSTEKLLFLFKIVAVL